MTPRTRRARRAFAAFALGALTLFAALAFLREAASAARGRESDPRLYPAGWLLGGPQVEPLRRTLALLGHRLPRDATVVVDSAVWDSEQLHYLTMWCAYYLPRQHVVHREFLAGAATPTYLLTLPPRAETPAGAVAIELPAGAPSPAVLSVHRLAARAGAS